MQGAQLHMDVHMQATPSDMQNLTVCCRAMQVKQQYSENMHRPNLAASESLEIQQIVKQWYKCTSEV